MNGEEAEEGAACTVETEGARVKEIEKAGDAPEETCTSGEETAGGPQARARCTPRPGETCARETRARETRARETRPVAPRAGARGDA